MILRISQLHIIDLRSTHDLHEGVMGRNLHDRRHIVTILLLLD